MTIDTSNWIRTDALYQLPTSQLQAFVDNGVNSYTLVESSSGSLSGTTTTGTDAEGRDYTQTKTTWFTGNMPFSGSAHLDTSLFSNSAYTGGNRVVRPCQHVTWTAAGGQHIHCHYDIRELDLFTRLFHDGSPGEVTTLRFRLACWYSSVSTNYSFPNFNDASVEMDIWLINKANPAQWFYIPNFPISTTGAPSTIVFASGSPANTTTGNVLYRGSIGTSQRRGYSLFHVPSHTQISNESGVHESAWAGLSSIPITSNGLPLVQRWILGYRLHSPTTPYVVAHNVSRQTNPANVTSQAGSYGSSEDHDVMGNAVAGGISTGSLTAESPPMGMDTSISGNAVAGGVATGSLAIPNVSPRELAGNAVAGGVASGSLAQSYSGIQFGGNASFIGLTAGTLAWGLTGDEDSQTDDEEDSAFIPVLTQGTGY